MPSFIVMNSMNCHNSMNRCHPYFSNDKSESEVTQSYPTLRDPVDCSLPGSSVHRILQARILEWVAISFSRGSSWPRDRTQVSRIAGRCFNLWATREAQQKGNKYLMCSGHAHLMFALGFIQVIMNHYFVFLLRLVSRSLSGNLRRERIARPGFI